MLKKDGIKNDLKPIIKTFKKVVIGISAGAINLSNISLCSKDEEDGVEKTITYEGIGRINYTIEPYFDIDNKILLQNELYPLSEKMTIYGLPNNNMNLNSKKPYLENKSRKTKVQYLVDNNLIENNIKIKYDDFVKGKELNDMCLTEKLICLQYTLEHFEVTKEKIMVLIEKMGD